MIKFEKDVLAMLQALEQEGFETYATGECIMDYAAGITPEAWTLVTKAAREDVLRILPEVEAVNNDDEHCYDAESASKFHIMMHRLGYKTTLAPYTNKSFWTSLCSKIHSNRPWAVDRIMVQCYDGGAYNNPSAL